MKADARGSEFAGVAATGLPMLKERTLEPSTSPRCLELYTNKASQNARQRRAAVPNNNLEGVPRSPSGGNR
jgi:hypothetical protein